MRPRGRRRTDDALIAGCLVVIVLKLVLWAVLWAAGWVALIAMIGLDLTQWQVGGGALLLALLVPVSVEIRR